jgi:ferric-dicitrate binding protein FerR (iron transport regulator)
MKPLSMEDRTGRIKDALSGTDVDMDILESPAVTAEMKRQWDAKGEPDGYMSRIGDNVRRSLFRHISGRVTYRPLRGWVRYGIAASILLAVSAGIGIGLNPGFVSGSGSVKYVYHSGNQDRVTVTLDDGTAVTLGARSKIVYPERFRGGERRIEMEGQAWFQVAPDAERPFVVETRGGLDVTALGTAFEVFENESRSFTEVILAEGRVKVDYPADGDTKSYTMIPNEKLVYLTGGNSVRVSPENAENYTAWKNRYGLTFLSEHFSNILPRLEKWYGCTIVCSSPEILDETFTFRVRTESPELIFDNMDRTLDINYVFDTENNRYTISLNKTTAD